MSNTMILGRGRSSVNIVDVGKEVRELAVDLETTIVKGHMKLSKRLVIP